MIRAASTAAEYQDALRYIPLEVSTMGFHDAEGRSVSSRFELGDTVEEYLRAFDRGELARLYQGRTLRYGSARVRSVVHGNVLEVLDEQRCM